MNTITAYKTDDGVIYEHVRDCIRHENINTALCKAHAMLHDGMTLDVIIKMMNEADIYFGCNIEYDTLKNINHTTTFKIPHWQCRDEPGYRVSAFNRNGQIYLWGHAGSWMGPYGSWISLEDLIRYYKDTYK